MVMTGYAVLLVVMLLAALFPFVIIITSLLVQSQNPTPLKQTVYESGMMPYGDAHIKFDVKFYLYALLFILFDIESIFLFPWAVSLNQLGLFALVEMFIFIGILALGLVYAWRKGALRWQ